MTHPKPTPTTTVLPWLLRLLCTHQWGTAHTGHLSAADPAYQRWGECSVCDATRPAPQHFTPVTNTRSSAEVLRAKYAAQSPLHM
ncbi:hypothetical protein ACOI1H_13385 [Loktanella sp. DJP18]|uniref:hypothetical protein n=1 Tax=Loktanella sp. DJP18 TaxID=3409788 RepID=UPI003BB4EF78